MGFMDFGDVVEALGLRPHPEGGWFVETWRGPSDEDGARPAVSTILYLLSAGKPSHWHRIDAAEIWQHAGGDALELSVWVEGTGSVVVHRLAGDLSPGSVLQAAVPAGAWQAATSIGAWTLVGCIVAPAFEFEGFELAPPDWEPPVGT
jgi:uncharacterized protein